MACAHRPPEDTKPSFNPGVVALPLKESPPADLLVCAERPVGFPEDLVATMPAGVRDAAIRIMRSLKDSSDRLDRLVNWHTPGSCGAPVPEK